MKKITSKLIMFLAVSMVMTLFSMGTFAGEGPTEVTTIEGLRDALDNTSVTNIQITGDIIESGSEKMTIRKGVTVTSTKILLLRAPVENNGTFVNHGSFTNNDVFTNNGTFENANIDGVIFNNTSSFDNNGTFTNMSTGATNSKTFNNNTESAFQNFGTFENNGSIANFYHKENAAFFNGGLATFNNINGATLDYKANISNYGVFTNTNSTVTNSGEFSAFISEVDDEESFFGALRDEFTTVVSIRSDLTIANDITIENDKIVFVDQNVTFTLTDSTKTIINNGSIEIIGTLLLENSSLINNNEINIDSTGELSISSSTSVTNNPSSTINNYGKFNTQGIFFNDNGATIENNNFLLNNGTFTNYGSVQNFNLINNYATFSGSGTLVNKGETSQFIAYVNTQAELEAALADASVTSIYIDGALTLDDNITIPKGKNVVIEKNMSLEIKHGYRFTVFGSVVNHGVIINDNAYINNHGTISGNGTIIGGVSTSYVGTEEDLKNAILYQPVTIMIENNLVISEDVTIPAGKELVSEDHTLTINENVTFTNNGSIFFDYGTIMKGIINNGFFINNGEISSEKFNNNVNANLMNEPGATFVNKGTLNNYSMISNNGTIENADKATIINDGEQSGIDNHSVVTNNGTITNQNGAHVHTNVDTEEKLVAALKDGFSSRVIVQGSISLTTSVDIPTGVILSVPFNCSLEITDSFTITNNGEINVFGGSITNNGAIDNNSLIEFNGTYSGNGEVNNAAGAEFIAAVDTENKLKDALAETAFTEVVLATKVTLNSYTVVSGTKILTIPEGMMLTINDRFLIETKAMVVNNGSFINNGIVSNSGIFVNNSTVINQDDAIFVTYVYNEKALIATLNDDFTQEIYISSDITLTADAKVEDSKSLYIIGGFELTIDEGVTFTNWGDIEIGSTLNNYGYVVNGSKINMEKGLVFNYDGASIVNNENAKIYGNAITLYGGDVTNFGTIDSELRFNSTSARIASSTEMSNIGAIALTYKVSFDYTGAQNPEFEGTNYLYTAVVMNGNIKDAAPALTAKDHVFSDWYLDKEFTNKWDIESEVTEAITLYPGWNFYPDESQEFDKEVENLPKVDETKDLTKEEAEKTLVEIEKALEELENMTEEERSYVSKESIDKLETLITDLTYKVQGTLKISDIDLDITATGKMPLDLMGNPMPVELSITEILDSNSLVNEFKDRLTGNAETVFAFDVKLTVNGQELNLTSDLEVTFDASSKVGETILLAHKKADGTWEYFERLVPANGKVTVNISSFSPFIALANVQASYYTTVAPTTNGTVTVDKLSAKSGETVTVTVVPNNGYRIDTMTIMNGIVPVGTTNTQNGYTFIMPSGDVQINLTFIELSVPVTPTPAPTTAPTEKPEAPQTGDYDNFLPIVIVSLVALTGIVLVLRKKLTNK